MAGNRLRPTALDATHVDSEGALEEGLEEIVQVGPSSPDTAPHARSDRAPWETCRVPAGFDLYVVGLHGGAGASTVASLFEGRAMDCGLQWPVLDAWERPLPPIPVIAVARAHHVGLEAARQFALQWAARQIPEAQNLLGLVLVDDAPDLLSAQKSAVKRVLTMTPHGWRLPWQAPWRVTAPGSGPLPRDVRRFVRSIEKKRDERMNPKKRKGLL